MRSRQEVQLLDIQWTFYETRTRTEQWKNGVKWWRPGKRDSLEWTNKQMKRKKNRQQSVKKVDKSKFLIITRTKNFFFLFQNRQANAINWTFIKHERISLYARMCVCYVFVWLNMNELRMWFEAWMWIVSFFFSPSLSFFFISRNTCCAYPIFAYIRLYNH